MPIEQQKYILVTKFEIIFHVNTTFGLKSY